MILIVNIVKNNPICKQIYIKFKYRNNTKRSLINNNRTSDILILPKKEDINYSLWAILKGAKMDENKHIFLREVLTNIVGESQFYEE